MAADGDGIQPRAEQSRSESGLWRRLELARKRDSGRAPGLPDSTPYAGKPPGDTDLDGLPDLPRVRGRQRFGGSCFMPPARGRYRSLRIEGAAAITSGSSTAGISPRTAATIRCCSARSRHLARWNWRGDLCGNDAQRRRDRDRHLPQHGPALAAPVESVHAPASLALR